MPRILAVNRVKAVGRTLAQRLLSYPGLVSGWPLDDTFSIQSYSRVVNPAMPVGRNMILTPDISSSTGWSVSGNWSIGNGVATSTPGGGGGNLLATIPIVAGRIYTVTYTVAFTAFNSITPTLGGTALTNRTTAGTYVENIIAGATNSLLGFPANTALGCTIDNVSVTEVNINASSQFPTLEQIVDGNLVYLTTSWTGTNWAITGNKLVHTPGATVAAIYALTAAPLSGRSYDVTFTISGMSAGGVTPQVGTTGIGTQRTANGTYTETIVAGGTLQYRFSPSSLFNGQINGISIVPHDGFVVWDGGFETWTTPTDLTYWSEFLAGTSTVNQETVIVHTPGGSAVRFDIDASTSGANITQTSLNTGKTYTVTYWARADVASGVDIRVIHFGSVILFEQALTDVYTQYSVTFLALDTTIGFIRGNGSASHSIYLDDVLVTEVPPIVGLINSVNSTGSVTTRPTIGVSSGGHLTTAYSFDGTDDAVNIYSSELNSVFNPNEGTIIVWAKVSGSGVWTDVTARSILRIGVDSNNEIRLRRSATSNNLNVLYVSGAVSQSINVPTTTTSFFQLAMTFSKSADQVKAYLNGVQVGSAATGLGVWIGNLLSSICAIGALTSTGNTVWSGLINDVSIYNRVLSDTEISNNSSFGGYFPLTIKPRILHP